MHAEEREILVGLLQESLDHLGQIEPDLLSLESAGDTIDSECVNRIFRAIHSIKGGFGFFGFQHITALGHSMENVLMQIRGGKLAITSETVDALLAGVDKMRMLLNDLEASDTVDISEEERQLAPFLSEPGDDHQHAPSASTTPTHDAWLGMSPADVRRALPPGHHLFRLTVYAEADLIARDNTPEHLLAELAAVGDVLTTTLTPEATPLEGKHEVLYTSVLGDPELVAHAAGLPQDQCALLEPPKEAEQAPSESPEPTDDVASETRADATGSSTPDQAAGPTRKARETNADVVRVRVDVLDNLMNLAGELVLGRNQILQTLNRPLAESSGGLQVLEEIRSAIDRAADTLNTTGLAATSDELESTASNVFARLESEIQRALAFRVSDMPGLPAILQNVDWVTSQLQENVMHTRMQPMSVLFGKFPRIVRDLGKKLGREIRLEMSGEDVELDKSIVEALSDPMTHLIRNSADHGIEPPEARRESGKPEAGLIRLSAYHQAGRVHIEIADDGSGINIARVKEKAIAQGLISSEAAGQMPTQDIAELIFSPGFSTAQTVSEVSGRGVGMDVVRTNVEALGGAIEVDTHEGVGTTLTLKLPLTLAIIPSLIVGVEGRRFAMPQVALEELVRLRASDAATRIERVQGAEVLRLREKLLPLVRLADVLDLPRTYTDPVTGMQTADRRNRLADRRSGEASSMEHEVRTQSDRRYSAQSGVQILVLAVDGNQFGLIVDELYDIEEIVVKPLSGLLKECVFYAGATIMGDGKVAMILDSAGIATTAALNFASLERAAHNQRTQFEHSNVSEAQALLLFRNHQTELLAINAAMVQRLDKVHSADIERVGDKEFLKYGDTAVRLVRLHEHLPLTSLTTEADSFYVILPKFLKYPLAIMASELVDTITTDVQLDHETVVGAGVLGSAVLHGELAVFIDVYGLHELVMPRLSGHDPIDGPGLEGMRVLLAEDTAFFRSMERSYLEAFGCEVHTANNGLEAWEHLCEGTHTYDLVVTDIEMPAMDGVELTRRIRQSGSHKDVPIVALSAVQADSIREEARSAGVDAWEQKLDRERLRETLAKVCNGNPANA